MIIRDNPIFILGAHKSGTSLLRSLFDGHKDLSVIPFESHVFEAIGLWISNPVRESFPTELSNDEFKKRVLKLLKFYNSKDHPMGDVILDGKINLDKFDSIFPDLSEKGSYAERVVVYLTLVLQLCELDVSKRFVEKTVENFEYVELLQKVFPNATFLHVIRNPYSNVLSMRRFASYKKGAYPRLDKIVKTISASAYYALKNEQVIKKYKILRYEDLVTTPDEIMMDVADFCQIEFDKNLLQPTSFGQMWKGNSSKNFKFNKIDSRNLNIWKENISKLEISVVNKKLFHLLNIFDYQKIDSYKYPILPCKGESTKKYLANRFYLLS